jgi:hypothetical protein
MVTQITPSANARADFEHLFKNAFTTNRQTQSAHLDPTENAPNKACGATLDPEFDALYIWSNNVNTLSLTNDLADLHELCRQVKAHNIGIAALQELNIGMTQTSIYQRVKAVFDEHFDRQCIIVCATTAI